MTSERAIADLRAREAFFYDHAGTSYRPGAETLEEGKRRGARELARAELETTVRGWRVVWEDDWDIGSHRDFYGPDSAYADREPDTCETAALVDESGDVLASLGCIDDATDEYRRVVAAELAAEALGELTSAPTDGQCDHDDVSIEYRTAIVAKVRDGDVWSVHVDDENLTGPISAHCWECDTDLPLEHPIVRAADTDHTWPSWEFGF